MKILIEPSRGRSTSELTMLRGLADALIDLGVFSRLLNRPVSPGVLRKILADGSYVVLLRMNSLRTPDVPGSIRVVSWFQDWSPSLDHRNRLDAEVGPRDIVYFAADPKALDIAGSYPCRAGILLPAVRARRGSSEIANAVYLVGEPVDLKYEGPRFSRLDRPLQSALKYCRKFLYQYGLRRRVHFGRLPKILHSRLIRELKNVVEANFEPLSGHFPKRFVEGEIRAVLERFEREHAVRRDHRFDDLLDCFVDEYPRVLDRRLLEQRLQNAALAPWIAKEVASDGSGSAHPDPTEAMRVRSLRTGGAKIAIYSDPQGIAMRTEALEAIMNGSLLLMHASRHDGVPGTIGHLLETDAHYGAYSSEDVESVVKRWIDDEKKRESVVGKAQDVLAAHHSWAHRASRVLDDLASD